MFFISVYIHNEKNIVFKGVAIDIDLLSPIFYRV